MEVKIYYPDDIYSKNKNKIKKPIKEAKLVWNFGKSSWSDENTVILADFEGTNLPATLHISTKDQKLIDDLIETSTKISEKIEVTFLSTDLNENKSIEKIVDEEINVPYRFKIANIESFLKRERANLQDYFKDDEKVEIQLKAMKIALMRIREKHL